MRTSAPVWVIGRDGVVSPAARPDPSGWMRLVGLDDGPARWRVPGGEDAAFIIIAGSHPHVLAVAPDDTPVTDEAADLAARYPDVPCMDRAGLTSSAAWQAWRAFVRRCEETDA